MRKPRNIILAVTIVLLLASGVVFNHLSSAKRQAQSMSCVSRMASICLAARLYASDRDGHFPTNFLSMSNELNTPKILFCNADSKHTRAASWETYSDANSSYVIVTPRVHEDATNTVFIRCNVHGHLGYPDGTMFDGVRRRGKGER